MKREFVIRFETDNDDVVDSVMTVLDIVMPSMVDNVDISYSTVYEIEGLQQSYDRAAKLFLDWLGENRQAFPPLQEFIRRFS